MIKIRLSNHQVFEFRDPPSGLEIAQKISKTLPERAVNIVVDGKIFDLSHVLENDAFLKIITKEDNEFLQILRHTTGHLMALAARELFQNVKFGTGPTTEDGFFYDIKSKETISEQHFEKIENKMNELIDEDLKVERFEWEKDYAISFFEDLSENFKVEILKNLEEDVKKVSVYKIKNCYDLCRGPHLPSLRHVGKHFKILKTSGAYWKGEKENESLQRIYGTVFPDKISFESYFKKIEEAEKRDHRKLGEELELFHLQEVSQGNVFWHPKGWTLYRTLENFVRSCIEKADYKEVKTPMLFEKKLWEDSGHWEKFKENMFVTECDEGKVMSLKPMNCPGHIQIFKQGIKSYKDLPLRMSEFGSCHRKEPSGALHGIMRLRGFVQDDAHIFCTKQQIVSETKNFCNLLRYIYKKLGFSNFFVKFSDRPEKRAGTNETWDMAENALKNAAIEAGLDFTLNPGDGAFYGPKLEFLLRDSIGRDWQCGTLQVDFVLPERLRATYVNEEGEKVVPVMLHRAILGSIERFIGILIEHYGGNFPVWLAPVQVVIATIKEDVSLYAKEVFHELKKVGIRTELDLRNEKISYKVREHSHRKVPYIFALGEKEKSEGMVSLRKFRSEENFFIKLSNAINLVQSEAKIDVELDFINE